jgi:hypothetical protein
VDDLAVAIDESGTDWQMIDHLANASLTLLQSLLGLTAQPRDIDCRPDLRQHFAGTKGFDQVVVRAGRQALHSGLLAGSGRYQDDRQGLRARIGAQSRKQP